MQKPDVILVQPPIQDFYLTKKRTIPYGLSSMAANIRQKGFNVEILDALASKKVKTIQYPEPFSFLKPFYNEKDISKFSLFHEYKHFGYSHEHIATKIREKQPFLVGISSLFTAYSDQAIESALTIKKFHPDCFIVLGGHHPTNFPRKILELDEIDFIIRGEGENSLALLCQVLKAQDNNTSNTNKKLKNIPGLCFKTKDGFHLSNPSWVKDFSDLALPASDLIDQDYYQRKNKRALSIVSSRGCPLRCSYCSVSASSSYGKFRLRPCEDVIREIENEIKTYDVGFIDFEDENLCFDKKWFFKVFTAIERLVKGKDIEIRAMNGLYPPSLDDETVSLMKRCGFTTLNLSLGSNSKDQLSAFKRPDVRNSFETALLLAEKHGLQCVSYIIAGAPGQSSETSFEDLLYLAQKRTLTGLSIYYPSPGSHDYQEQKKFDLLPIDFKLMRSSALPFDNTTTRLESVTLLRLSRILNFMKQLIDDQGIIPTPQPFPDEYISLDDRETVSSQLLQWFLYDGIIRGFSPEGRVFEHLTDKKLSKRFSKEIKQIEVKGIK